ncbi:Uncharacterized membrane protein YccC [Arboricoccus pini]|uniref:Uncharacterized membrane protein YccC n=1 Tax=Arboricoccus pini TaxID=1963835 RepID=A0A212RZK4_9PROT|nr:FUSC family protein [Arboricoccus pini]SNB78305.1 Uncharacterized membrane protein YccC [Arboricoccus pini]
MLIPGWRAWVFSLKAYIAMALALFIAFSIDLPRPYWAMGTVYIVAQPLSGMVQSKAAYRVAGTLGGAIFAIFVMPIFITSPELLTAVLALWTGLCLYCSLMDKTPRSYAFMLAGYTAAFISFPSVGTPQNIFDIGLARSEEIILAILCVTVIDMLILPQRVGPVLEQRLDIWFANVIDWARGVLLPRNLAEGASTDDAPHRLILDAVAIEQLRTHAAFDTPRLRRVQPSLFQLQQRMQSLFAVISALDDRLTQIRQHRPDLAAELDSGLEEIELWVKDPDPGRVQHLHKLLHSLEPSPAAIRESRDELLLANAIARLRNLVDYWVECQVLRAEVTAGTPAPRASAPIAVHRDHAMAALSAVAAMLAVGVCCTFWIAAGWSDGASAPMMAAVLCCFFATQDDPSPMIATFVQMMIFAVGIAGLYLFWVFPAIDGYTMLVASLAPFTILAGTYIAMPQTMLYGLALVVNAAASMGLAETYTADVQSFLNSSTALVLGSYTALVVTRLVRTVGADFMVRRLVRAMQRDLADISLGRLQISREHLEGRMFDRISALIPRVRGQAPEQGMRVLREALADFRLGYNLLTLRRLRKRLSTPAREQLASFLRSLPPFFKRRRSGRDHGSAALLDELDRLIATIGREPSNHLTNEILLTLIGSRRALCPEATFGSAAIDSLPPGMPPSRARVGTLEETA